MSEMMTSVGASGASGASSLAPAPAMQPAGVRRVLMTADAVGGVWRYSLDLARGLSGRGIHVMLAVLGPAPNAAQRREAMRAGVPIVDSPYRLEWMDDADEDVERAGEWLLRLEQALRPDVVHLNGYAHAALLWSAPALVVAHSCVRTWWKAVKSDAAPARYDRYSARVLDGLRAAPVVVAPSQAMLDALAREYALPLAPSRRACVIPNGCVTCASDSAALWHGKQPFVFTAGRVWDEAKNIGALCEVAERLSWPVCVAGDACGPDGGVCPLGTVRALGRLSTRQMRGFYRRASIYALPARYEPFGLSVLEAAAAGCALVLGDIPSLRENWDDAAVFVRPGDSGALAASIQTLIDDPRTRVEFGRRALARASAFSITRTCAEYVSLYESLIA
jgi:glycosyltransferase involved in cell wall biosynthesis